MLYSKDIRVLFMGKPKYRTISETGKVLEIWSEEKQVQPTLDYHKIQYVSSSNRIISEWNSMYDFLNIPH